MAFSYRPRSTPKGERSPGGARRNAVAPGAVRSVVAGNGAPRAGASTSISPTAAKPAFSSTRRERVVGRAAPPRSVRCRSRARSCRAAADRFGHEALPPVGRAEPVAEFDRVRRACRLTMPIASPASASARAPDAALRRPGCACALEHESLAAAGGIRMGDSAVYAARRRVAGEAVDRRAVRRLGQRSHRRCVSSRNTSSRK